MQAKDSELKAIRDVFVRPFYMSLLHGNLRWRDKDPAVGLPAKLGAAARAISDAELNTLLEEQEWRGRLTAAWFIGLTKRAHFVDTLGRLLLASELTYAGQGYCLALGLIGGPSCEGHLRSYLAQYLPLQGRFYDQTWAIGALAYLRGGAPEEFLQPSLWTDSAGNLDPLDGIENFADLVGYLVRNRYGAATGL